MKNIYKAFTILLAILFYPGSTLFSQGVIDWQKTIGGSGDDYFQAVQKTSDGGYILGGYSNSGISGDKSENNLDTTLNSIDYWIIKVDSSGNIEWQNTIGGDNNDVLYSLQETSDGGYILGGSSASNISGDKTKNNYDTTLFEGDYWIVKIDMLGNIQWQNTIGGTGIDILKCVHQTTDGGYILGGSSRSDISGVKTENNWDTAVIINTNDYWIVKTDSLGNIQWQNTIGGIDDDVLYSLDQTADNGYILGGYSKSNISGDKTENVIGFPDRDDYWIVKVDESGNIQWDNTIGGDRDDWLVSIRQTSDGGYILGGNSWSSISGDKTENLIGWNQDPDYWIIKTDSLGNIQWQNTIGGEDGDYLSVIEETIDKGYILGGFSQSGISGDKTESSNGNFNYWIVKTDSSGNIIWQNTIGGDNYEALYSIHEVGEGEYILGGCSNSDISGDKTQNNRDTTLMTHDYWVIKLTNKYNSITGKCFIDVNGNFLQDNGEVILSNGKITELNTGRFAFSGYNGNYSVSVLDTGNFSVSCTSTLNYYSAMPINYVVYFSDIFKTDSLNDFAFQPIGVFNDLCLTITPLGRFRSGLSSSYMINYTNAGTTTINNCSIIFFPDTELTFISALPPESSVAADSIVWNLGSLNPYQTGSIVVTVNVNAGTPLDAYITSSTRIDPVAGDVNPGCNYATREVLVVGSNDPNDILVNEDTLTTTELISQPYLDYTIRFQNTGNDTAFNINIYNIINGIMLDINSIEFVNSSHPVGLNWNSYLSRLEFKFENILLPDSNASEPLSHGFVTYRIQAKTTILAGDSIVNNASIYFDYNSPVNTNDAITRIILPTGGNQSIVGNGALTVYPNPTGDELTVKIDQVSANEKTELKIYDLTGRAILYKSLTSNNSKLSIAHFSPGVYLLEVAGEKKSFRTKFVKQ